MSRRKGGIFNVKVSLIASGFIAVRRDFFRNIDDAYRSESRRDNGIEKYVSRIREGFAHTCTRSRESSRKLPT